MVRRKNDFYPTPAQLTKELLKRVNISGTVFECCVGDWAIAKELNLTWGTNTSGIIEVFTNDIDCKFNCDFTENATYASNWKKHKWQFDWTVTNPPFICASDIIPLAWNNSRIGIAFLLRLSYLEPAKNRGAWLQEHSQYLTDLIIFGQPRPSFTNNSKVDTATTAWFVWQKKPKQSGTI